MPRLPHSNGVETRRRILEEAEHLIHVRGFRATSLEDIAARCRMTKANLLHHFRSKEALGLAALDFKAGCYKESCLCRHFAPGRSPEEAIASVFDEAARFQRGNGCRAGCFVGNIALEMSDQNPRFRERADRFFEEWTGALARLLEDSLGAEAPRAAEAVLALYEGATMLARTRRDPSVLERARDHALALLRTPSRRKNDRR